MIGIHSALERARSCFRPCAICAPAEDERTHPEFGDGLPAVWGELSFAPSQAYA